jgi:16S rRNA A1518/A1519 N6-dimethyltransferase RsmA/KsgA/DIM1 with predicted DNA glycosylase/AP lyase activity
VPGQRRGGSPSRRRLGQHFLDSGRLASRLVADAAVMPHDRVVELGAGTGLLTGALAERAAAVLAVEVDATLARRLAERFGPVPNVFVLRADLNDVPLPATPYRVVANPPFARTARILHRLLDDPGGGMVRADLVVQWQVARQRVRVQGGPPTDLLGAIWGPWWLFTRGRRLPPQSFNPRPSVAAAVLEITRREPPLLVPRDFERYETFVRREFAARAPAPRVELASWVERFRAGARAPACTLGRRVPT